MLREVIWKQWKTPHKRAWGLRELGICNDLAKPHLLQRRPLRMGGATYMRDASYIKRSAYPQRPRKLFGLLRD